MKKTLLEELLTEKRIAANLTQKEVAKLLGYESAQYVSNWERGISQPPAQSLKKIAHLYRASAEELFDAFLLNAIHKAQNDLKRKFNMGKR